LSAEGKLYTCLFAGKGFDLRGPMRRGAEDAELLSLIEMLWKHRVDRYSEKRGGTAGSSQEKVEMNHICYYGALREATVLREGTVRSAAATAAALCDEIGRQHGVKFDLSVLRVAL